MADGLFAFISAPGPMEMIIFGVIAVLLFGKRLPEVGRSLGRGIIEFRKGVQGIEDEFRSAATSPPPATSQKSTRTQDDREELLAPKFEPPTQEPTTSGDTFQD